MGMVSITYRAPIDDSAVVEMRGVRFFDGEPKTIDAKENADLVAKLRTNRFFEVKDMTIKEAIRADNPIAPQPHHDDEKALLVAEATALGIHVDKRWSVSTLEAEISKAKIAKAE